MLSRPACAPNQHMLVHEKHLRHQYIAPWRPGALPRSRPGGYRERAAGAVLPDRSRKKYATRYVANSHDHEAFLLRERAAANAADLGCATRSPSVALLSIMSGRSK